MNQKSLPSAYFYLSRYLGGLLLFAAGALSALQGQTVLPCVLFLCCLALECALSYIEEKIIFSLRVFFTISWLFGISLESLKLSNRQTIFSPWTYVCMAGFYFGFLAAFDFVSRRKQKAVSPEAAVLSTEIPSGQILKAIYGVAILGTIAFFIECLATNWAIPLIIRGEPHMYTSFHVTGVHYFVVSWIFVPALTVLYLFKTRPEKSTACFLALLNTLAFLVPLLILSKLQLAFTLAFPAILFLLINKHVSRRKLLLGGSIAVMAVIILFAFIIQNRNYPEGYLAEIFAFKEESTPVWIQYPYIYIVNNFDNLDLLVKNLETFSCGSRVLYPLVALTGLKFLPSVAAWLNVPVFYTIEELTTVTILYDAYGDFGVPGTLLFGLLLGAFSAFVAEKAKTGSLFYRLLFGQLALYLGLAFFSTWFSNPTTWFYFAATLAIGLYCTKEEGKCRFFLKKVLTGGDR